MTFGFIPIDITPPIIDPVEAARILKSGQGNRFGDKIKSVFKYRILRDSSTEEEGALIKTADKNLHWQWLPLALEKFPEFVAWCEQLPFDLITRVSFIQSKCHVPPHQDPFFAPEDFLDKYEPLQYRVLVSGSISNCMYICSDREYVPNPDNLPDHYVPKGKIKFLIMPDDTKVFVLNNSKTLHGSFYNGQKTLCYINGYVSPEKHKQLLERSVEKYRSHCIPLPL